VLVDNRTTQLNLKNYDKEGFYLIFDNETRVFMDRDSVFQFGVDFLENPKNVSADIKDCVDFQRCDVCPEKEKSGFCHAILPSLLFFNSAEKYLSYSDVLVVVKIRRPGMDHPVFHTARTTMQQALKYVSIYSLMYYCEVGRKYWKYFTWIDPLLPAAEIAGRLYLNIYWYHKGDRREVEQVIRQFRDEISITSQCQMKRLRLICKSDALLNSLVLAQIITEILKVQAEVVLGKVFQDNLNA
jgi:hypothetical protein